jgi:septal ring factor EnvC (AmiA/AmiB activator)
MTPEERLAALEQLEVRQKRNQRRTLWAAWGSIVVAVVVLGALIVSIFDLNREATRLMERNQQLDKQNEEKTRELKEKQDQLGKVNAELAQKQDLLAAVKQTLGTDNVSAAKNLIVASEPASSRITPRIFIHIRSQDQTSVADRLAAKFKSKGYSVPKAEILVNTGPARPEIRYFHKNEKEANEAAELAADVGGETRARYISGYENSPLVKPRQFELWLAPGS